MQKKNELISQLLKLNNDWRIISVDLDPLSDRIDIVLRHSTQKRGLFGLGKGADTQNAVILRHLPFAGMRTYVHISEFLMMDHGQFWSEPNSSLTHEMEKFVVELLNSCYSTHAIGKLAQLTVKEIKDISQRTGVHIKSHEPSKTTSRNASQISEADTEIAAFDQASARSFELEQPGDIPPETDEIWQTMINGNIPIKSGSVALQMLLERIRQNITLNPTEVVRLSSAKLLRRYLVKNQKQHPEEVKRLLKHEQQPQGSAAVLSPVASSARIATPKLSLELPDKNDLCWQKIITGAIQIDTNKVGLQMMIQRIRLAENKETVTGTQIAGSGMLNKFFWKHQKRLQEEIAQIVTTAAPVVDIDAPAKHESLIPPPVKAPVWQQMITGEMTLHTSAVALQMMMERIRLSVERDPSVETQAAGINILRRFFIKHSNHLQAEIQQLGGMATIEPKKHVPSTKPHAVPPDNHPSWQKLINGELSIQTDVVALQMMLERIRISIEKNPTDNSRIAGAKILRRYFLKHKRIHQAELDQLLLVA